MIVLDVSGMACAGCEKAVKAAIAARDPSAEVTVSLASGRVEATTTLTAEDAVSAIAAAGYEARAVPN